MQWVKVGGVGFRKVFLFFFFQNNFFFLLPKLCAIYDKRKPLIKLNILWTSQRKKILSPEDHVNTFPFLHKIHSYKRFDKLVSKTFLFFCRKAFIKVPFKKKSNFIFSQRKKIANRTSDENNLSLMSFRLTNYFLLTISFHSDRKRKRQTDRQK